MRVMLILVQSKNLILTDVDAGAEQESSKRSQENAKKNFEVLLTHMRDCKKRTEARQSVQELLDLTTELQILEMQNGAAPFLPLRCISRSAFGFRTNNH